MTAVPPGGADSTSGQSQAPPVCPRHPDRVAYIRCQRCERPMCPDCQRAAAVGSQCVDCVREHQKSAPTTRSIFGGRATDGTPIVTYTLIGICVVLFLAQQLNSRVTQELMFAPALGASEPWRYLSAAFVHGTVMHILFNMYALWFCGQYLEPMLGRARFLAVYLVSALGGSVCFAAFGAFASDPWGFDSLWLTPTVGASGAVFGLFAAVVVLNRRLGRDTGPMLVMIAINAALPLFVGSIAWQAHLGGAIIGAVVAGAIAGIGRDRANAQWGAIAGVAALLVAAAIGLDAYVGDPVSVFRRG
ncbi:rhomboid family intramembrane serine protease [Dermacoccaceae bacterium W4C1]